MSSLTKAEAGILDGWHRRLDRLDEDVVGQLQTLACCDHLLRALGERHSKFIQKWAATVYMHGAAIGIRRVFKEGNTRQNVSIERFLKRLGDHASLLRKHGNEHAIRRWLGLSERERLTDKKIALHINSEIDQSET
jgi:hypothetical protein